MAEQNVRMETHLTIAQLIAKIVEALAAGKHVYIGAASTAGAPEQSMCHRQGSKCKPNATSRRQKSSRPRFKMRGGLRDQ